VQNVLHERKIARVSGFTLYAAITRAENAF